MFLNNDQKKWLKTIVTKIDKSLTNTFFKYDSKDLEYALRQLGIKSGDTVLLHVTYKFNSGYVGKPQSIVDVLIDIIGDNGNLLMVSLPYTGSTLEYLQKNEVFDVRKSVSQMGIITEIFRRRQGVLRSLHPAHPVLVYGKDSEYIVKDHDKCIFSCGKGSPFEKFYLLKGKILFFDTTFRPITFLHYIEDIIKNKLPFPLYTAEPIRSKVIDYNRNEIEITTFPFDRYIFENRDSLLLGKYLDDNKKLRKKKIGRTELILVDSEDAVWGVNKLLENGILIYRGHENKYKM
jgi:aminoglycoside N3'-acetyltransferase